MEPDILILDEVLSVGDEGFKDTSAHRIKKILANGVTGILVSHSVQQVRDLCNKALWLDHGRQIAFGPSHEVCNAYSAYIFSDKNKRKLPETEEEVYQNSELFLLAWRLSVKERAAKTNPPGETETVRLQRLMNTVMNMSPEEKQSI